MSRTQQRRGQYRVCGHSSVQRTVVVVGAGAGEGGAGFVPGLAVGVVRRRKAQGARTLQFVLQTPT